MPGLIKHEDIEKVRATADLYDVISADVTLKPAGTGTFMGLCPFHDEKTASFSVRPSLGTWHCFGCGLGGDIFGYVEQAEDVGFADAVEILADRYHIELHYENAAGGVERKGSTRSRLLEANDEAQRFFMAQMMTAEALPARQLLAGRNFTQADSERFGCGYAPQGWDNLVRHLSDKGFTQQEMVDAGLARRGNRGIYDYFRGRLTWPIRDATGRTLGFGARKLYDDDSIQAKYINTPDTTLYHKNQVLYGLDLAKPEISKTHAIVIVEGYTDVMACHIAGITNAVATCGTAFGAEHVKIVRRFISDNVLSGMQLRGTLKGGTARVTFTFDGDSAGQKAAMHAFGLDNAFLMQAFVAVADNNMDPCDLRIAQGDEAIRALIRHATPIYDFTIRTVLAKFDTNYAPGQVGAVQAVAPIIAQIRDESLRFVYAQRVARSVGVDINMLFREVNKAHEQLRIRDMNPYVQRQPNVGSNAGQLSSAQRAYVAMLARYDALSSQQYVKLPVDDTVLMCEQELLAMIIQVPLAINPQIFAHISEQSFSVPVFKSIYTAIIAAGGLPSRGTELSQGLWIHQITKAGGAVLENPISHLAAMPLPLPQQVSDEVVEQTQHMSASSPLREPLEAEVQFATELLVRLLDLGYMRAIARARQGMSNLPQEQQIELLGEITRLEANRKNLQAEVFGNTVG